MDNLTLYLIIGWDLFIAIVGISIGIFGNCFLLIMGIVHLVFVILFLKELLSRYKLKQRKE